MKPIWYFGRFWIGWCNMPCSRLPWFRVNRPGRGIYVSVLKLTVAWA